MNLAFSTKWKPSMPEGMAGNPTHFVEKILHSFSNMNDDILSNWIDSIILAKKQGCYDSEFAESLEGTKGKIHTLRENKSKRWNTDRTIHYVINQRTPQQFRFWEAPVTNMELVELKCTNEHRHEIDIYINNFALNMDERKKFAENDGFDYWKQFHSWFYPMIQKTKNNSLKLDLIQWTDFRY